MTTQQAVDLFAVLQDKYGSPDFSTTETVNLLNMATSEWLNRQFPTAEGGLTNVEQDSNTLHLIKPLIYPFSIPYSSISTGLISTSVLNAALQASSADSETIFRFLEVNYVVGTETYPVRLVFNNNYSKSERNTFKQARVPDKVKYQLLATGIKMRPATGYASGIFNFTVIKTPKKLSASTPVNPEVADEAMYNIIAIALKLAGVATRDEELLGAVRASAVQVAQ